MKPTLQALDAILTKHEQATSGQALALFLDVCRWRDAFACLAAPPPEPCIGRDPLCPCQDGDSCHYRDDPATGTKAWPIKAPEPRACEGHIVDGGVRLCRRCGPGHIERCKPESQAMPPIEPGDWFMIAVNAPVNVKNAGHARALKAPNRRNAIREIRKANGTVWTREPRR